MFRQNIPILSFFMFIFFIKYAALEPDYRHICSEIFALPEFCSTGAQGSNKLYRTIDLNGKSRTIDLNGSNDIL